MTRRWQQYVPHLLLALVAAAASIGWWRSDQERRSALEKVAALESAAAKATAASSQSASATAPHTEPGGSPSNTPLDARARRDGRAARSGTGVTGEGSVEADTIEELRRRVQDLARDLTAAREEASKYESKAVADAAELKSLQAQVTELREGQAQTRRAMDAMEAELKVKSERLVRAESGEKNALEKAQKAEAAATRTVAQSRELDDLVRRRESTAASLQRRYRDVTDMYRNFALNVQTRDTQNPGLQAGDLSRIQSAMQQAEDDLRQLQSLNLRVAQLARVSK
jgi:hypothetical protein